MADKKKVGEWKPVTIEGKIRKSYGKWWQLERKDGKKYIMTEVPEFRYEDKEDETF